MAIIRFHEKNLQKGLHLGRTDAPVPLFKEGSSRSYYPLKKSLLNALRR
jgi:hypothetical protein